MKLEQQRPKNIKEEALFNLKLKAPQNSGSIQDNFLKSVESTGGQIPRIYGLAKVHKRGDLVWPILRAGFIYLPLCAVLFRMLSELPECNSEVNGQRLKLLKLNF